MRRRWLAQTTLCVFAALPIALASSLPAAAQASDDDDLVALARSFNAAWNRHALDLTVAHFAPDATVVQNGVSLNEFGPHVQVDDSYGRRLTVMEGSLRQNGSGVTWAAGENEIRRWLSSYFADGHLVNATGYSAAGEEVSWHYRASIPPPRGAPALPPSEGIATALMRSGRIAQLTFESDRASVRRRREALERQILAALWRAGPDGDRSRQSAPRRDIQQSGEASPVRGVLPAAVGLAASAALAALTRPQGQH